MKSYVQFRSSGATSFMILYPIEALLQKLNAKIVWKSARKKARRVPLGKSCPAEGWSDLFIYSYRPLVLAAARSNHAPNLFPGTFSKAMNQAFAALHTQKAYRRKINQFAWNLVHRRSVRRSVGVNKHSRVQVAHWKFDALLKWGSDFCETIKELTEKQVWFREKENWANIYFRHRFLPKAKFCLNFWSRSAYKIGLDGFKTKHGQAISMIETATMYSPNVSTCQPESDYFKPFFMFAEANKNHSSLFQVLKGVGGGEFHLTHPSPSLNSKSPLGFNFTPVRWAFELCCKSHTPPINFNKIGRVRAAARKKPSGTQSSKALHRRF